MLWVAGGLGLLWFCWGTWNSFAQFESGQRRSLKVRAPIAMVYNFGGVWIGIAKGACCLFIGASGIGVILIYGAALFSPQKELSDSTPQPLTPQPAAPVGSASYDVSYKLEVTQAQIANEEQIVLAGPNGRSSIKRNKTFRDGRLRFAQEGFVRKGDLSIYLTVRE